MGLVKPTSDLTVTRTLPKLDTSMCWTRYPRLGGPRECTRLPPEAVPQNHPLPHALRYCDCLLVSRAFASRSGVVIIAANKSMSR